MSVEKINKLKPAEFSYNNPNDGDITKLTMGVMAQDVNKVWPYEKYSILQKDLNGYFSVDYSQFIAPMLKAIQELNDKVENLELQLKNK
jgi:hypothetical protein|tara:strand:+ start:211 stop:477 length:267 start_codon:yes stop_codon:yes gene_type:complete